MLPGVFCAASFGGWLAASWIRSSHSASPVTSETFVPAKEAATPPVSRLPANLQSWLQEIRDAGSPVLQNAAAAALAARLSPGEWPLVLKNLRFFSPQTLRIVLEKSISFHWTTADPAGAARWAVEHPGSATWLGDDAAAAMVRKDPSAAREWFETLAPEQRERISTGFYSALAAKDPKACLAMLVDNQDKPEVRRSGWMLEGITAQNPALTEEIANSITDPELSKDFRNRSIQEMARKDFPAAVDWAANQVDPNEMLVQVFRQNRVPADTLVENLGRLSVEDQAKMAKGCWVWWENYKPADMLAALKQAPASLSRDTISKMMRRTISNLVRQDPVAAREILEKDWGGWRTDWIPTLAMEWGNQDPAAVRAWLEGLPPSPEKEKAVTGNEKQLGHQLEREQRMAESIVDSTLRALPKDNSNSFERPRLELLAPGELQALWQKIDTLPEADRSKARENLIDFQARNYPAEAAAWISQAEPTPETVSQASRLAANWVRDDAPAAAAWATALPEGEARTWAVWNLARQWSLTNPAAAGAWLEKLPDATTRDLAANAFTGKRPDPKPAGN